MNALFVAGRRLTLATNLVLENTSLSDPEPGNDEPVFFPTTTEILDAEQADLDDLRPPSAAVFPLRFPAGVWYETPFPADLCDCSRLFSPSHDNPLLK